MTEAMNEAASSWPSQENAGEAVMPQPTLTQTLGDTLRDARQARGLSVDEVARIIRFSPRQIEAMECDDFGKLPGVTVIRGFIRSYAKLLKLDASALLAIFERQMPSGIADVSSGGAMSSMATMATMATMPRMTAMATLPGGARRKTGYLLLGLIFCAVLFVGFGVFHFLAPSLMSGASGDPVSSTHAGTPHVPPLAADTRDALLAAPPAATATQPAGDASVSPATAVSPVQQTEAGEEKSPQSQQPQQSHRTLTFDFEESAWLEVREASRKMLLAQNNLRGTQKVVTGQPPFFSVIGNASHVRLHYDEQTIDLQPWTRVDVARLTLE